MTGCVSSDLCNDLTLSEAYIKQVIQTTYASFDTNNVKIGDLVYK